MFEDYNFIGKSLEEVEQWYHLSYRIASKDGNYYMLTQDFHPERFNFHLEDDIIVRFTKG